ncbi:type II iodothyronine deiodinase-like [Acropora muricata]|uniref:type II iodothyronine deiodinase-like n=1 Tax=Acropora muricata TaxID=159855 RepID=UPI0034E4C758
MIQRLLIYSFLVVVFALGWLLKAFPVFKSFVSLAMCKITDTSLPAEIYWDSLFSWKMLQNVYHCLLIDINKRVKLGSKAYNSPVVSIEGKRCHRLLDFSRANRPLVINFGSSTCPVFMEMLRRYRHLRDQFSKVADFAVVYIEEAHPEDGWAFKGTSDIPMHRTLEERCIAAQKMASSVDLSGFHVTVDTMLNGANIAYGAIPIRLYIVQDKRVAYQGGAGPLFYRMHEVSEWLQKYREKLSRSDERIRDRG